MYIQYMNRIGGSASLYNGPEYEGAYPRVLGSPFWNATDFAKGSVGYEGINYHDVLMAYDVVRNELVIKGFQGLSLRLEKAKVDYFILSGHSFIHLNDSAGKNSLPDDFYDLLYDGDVQAYAKRLKRISPSLHAEGLDSITTNAMYFLHQRDRYYTINSEKDMLKIFSNEKDTLQKLWKEKGLNFKKDPDLFIKETLIYRQKPKNK